LTVFVFRYHLKEYSQVNPPTNARELFNLRHATLRSIIERCIGRVKRRWRIFNGSGELKLENYCLAIIAAGLMHNFLIDQNDEWEEDGEEEDDADYQEDESFQYINSSNEAIQWRDRLAETMWAAYQIHHG
jgi:hypothetical protein